MGGIGPYCFDGQVGILCSVYASTTRPTRKGCGSEVIDKAITESAGVWRSLGIPVLLTLLVALAALACIDPEPFVVAPTQPPAPTAAPALTEAQVAATAAAPTPEPTPAPLEEINFAGVVTRTNPPSQVQIVFSLRDQDGHAIALTAEDVQRATKIYECESRTEEGCRQGTEDWEEIDYTETSFFVHTAENFDLEVVFVLDFTNSMAQARLPDGRSGIAAMLEAVNAGLGVLPGAHRIGVVEFHDRNVEPGVLSTLTTNRQAIRDNISQFSQSGFDPGSSRVWDSVVAGTDLFSTFAQNPRAIRALVFLSDGRDTSSVNTRDDMQLHAQARNVQLYALGVGEVFQEEDLRELAGLTGGGYYPVHDVSVLQRQLQLLVSDLRGQYQVSYITLRRSGEYRTQVAVELVGVMGSMQTATFNAATFFGPDNQGAIQFDPPSIDRNEGKATIFVRALHMPRNIDRVRFKVDTFKPVQVDLVAGQDGGLLDGWNLSGPDTEGFYEVSSPVPVEFGNFGLLFRLTISDVTEENLEIPVEFDNTIYTAGKSLERTALIAIGQTRIAFTNDRDGNWDIYVMNSDGSGETRLTERSGYDWGPVWSPDGQLIAFASERNGDWNIFVMNADGSGVTQLTNHPGYDVEPAWSASGEQIAFSSTGDEGPDIYVMNADGSGVTQLTNHPGYDVEPAWSPDGRLIAFASDRDANVDTVETGDIYVMNADGSDVRRLTDNPLQDRSPAWSPGGRQIAFSSSRDGDSDIYVMNADGSGVRRLTDNPEWDGSPAWSPGGRQIAFSSNRDGDSDIYVMNADGSGVRQLTDNPGRYVDLDWSPQ